MSVLFPTNRFSIEPRRRDRNNQRLPPGPGRGDKDIPEIAVRLCVQLVEDDTMRVEPVLRRDVRTEHTVHTARLRNNDRALETLAALRKLRGFTCHLTAQIEDDRCLLAIGGSPVDLRPGLVIHEEKIERNARRQGALTVLPGHLDVRDPILARAVRPFPSKQRANNLIFLPLLENERLTSPFPLDVLE